jgi:hypothetical protein
MTKEELIEFGFDRIDVSIEESGDNTAYYYYKLKVTDTIVLLSDASDSIKNNEWRVSCHDNELAIDSLEDLEIFASLVRRLNKNFE